MSTPQTQRLINLFWPDGDGADSRQIFAVMDGARNPQLAQWIRLRTLEHECLYRGELTLSLQNAAPYVVRLSRDARFTGELLDRGWSRSWGFFTRVPARMTLEQLRRHLRTLLRVQDESGRKLVFRFYDPRVLRTYLPTCTSEEAKQFFGPLPELLSESENSRTLLSYTCGKRGVEIEEFPL